MIRCAISSAVFALLIASLTVSQAYDDAFTPLELIPRYRGGDPIHSEVEFEEFLDLMLTASGPQDAYDRSAEKFGRFPLRFGHAGFNVIIVSLRYHVLHPFAGCAFLITKAEYISPTSKPRGNRGWIYIFPGGPITKDVVMPGRETEFASTKEAFAHSSGSDSWGVLRGTADGRTLFNRFDKYCQEQQRTPSWPHYRER